jgi:hypothetical protein
MEATTIFAAQGGALFYVRSINCVLSSLGEINNRRWESYAQDNNGRKRDVAERCCYMVKAENMSFLPSIKMLPPQIISTYKISLVAQDNIPNSKLHPIIFQTTNFTR